MGCRWYPSHAHSGVAQLAERRTVNPQVVGSIPTPGAKNIQVRDGLPSHPVKPCDTSTYVQSKHRISTCPRVTISSGSRDP